MDAGLINLLSLSITSLTALGLAWIGLKQAALAKILNDTTSTISELEKNTNSIKDALILTTDAKARAEGKLEGQKEQIAITALKAEGLLEGSKLNKVNQ